MSETDEQKMGLIAVATPEERRDGGPPFKRMSPEGMPLKYQFDMPMAVRIAGSVHGLLFLIYIGMLVHTWASQAWPLKMFIAGLFAAIPPFGTFIYDHFMVKAYVDEAS